VCLCVFNMRIAFQFKNHLNYLSPYFLKTKHETVLKKRRVNLFQALYPNF